MREAMPKQPTPLQERGDCRIMPDTDPASGNKPCCILDGGSARNSRGAPDAAAARAAKRPHAGAPRPRVTDEITRLEMELSQRQREVDALWERRHVLRARTAAVDIITNQYMAILRLGATLQQQQQQQQGDADGPPPLAPEPLIEWQTHYRQLATELAASGLPLAEPTPDADLEELGWSPAAAAATARTMGVDLTLEGLRRKIREFTERTGHLSLKARPGSTYPNADAVRRRVESERASLLEFCALLVVCGGGAACSELLLTAMDAPPGAPREPPPSSPEWMQWLARQLALDPGQDDLVFATLQSLSARQAPVQDLQERLLHECSEAAPPISIRAIADGYACCCGAAAGCAACCGGGGGDEGPERVLEELVAQLSAGLNTYQLIAVVYMLSVYGTIFRSDQFAGYLLCAWPYMPSLSGLRGALGNLRAARRGAGGSGGGAAGSGSGGGAAGSGGGAETEAAGPTPMQT
ncbi:MAG: hypothetical protein J3K34DRAFT_523664 [Monoraphidium minutum]|nr:MAG: hypothetical protein J3K34DRAFT_523664 [Monoraphidium minutum]